MTAAAGSNHLLSDLDLDVATQKLVLADAQRRKTNPASGSRDLVGRAVALVFERPSTRTRLSFEVGVARLGGHPVVVDASTTQLGRGETLQDTARIFSTFTDAIVMRTGPQERLAAIAETSAVPVVNALTDDWHPCQALADLLTLQELTGRLAGVTLTYLGDGNNMTHSLLVAGATAGLHVRVATPATARPSADVVALAQERAELSGGSVLVTDDAELAASGADALYTDVWTSMGQEASPSRLALLEPYRLTPELLALAAPGASVLHCLPAHRGEEISAEVMDGPASVVWQQAGNRLPVQQAVLVHLIGHGR